MIGFVLSVIVILGAGFAVSERLWRRLDPDAAAGACERLLAGAVLGVSMWMAINWLLALAHLLTRPALLAALVALAVVAVALRPRLPRVRVSWFVIPIAAWCAFALWKGDVLPPQSHDALAYHLPKAVMILRAHGYEHFVAPDERITNLPANYELLLADVLALSGSDRLTEWLNTLAFILFLCTAAAFAERWWASPHRALVALATGTAPVLLLHSAADKNDVPACLFAAAALLWGGRWSARGGRMPMLLLIASLGMSGGLKPNAAAVAAGLAPFVLLRLRSLRSRDVALTAATALAAFVLLGGASYIDNALHAGAPLGVNVAGVKAGGGVTIAWGDFANLWRVPLLMLIVPFVPYANAVWVPWRNEIWFWPHYEIYFSHYGPLVSVLALLLPLCAVRYRRAGDDLTRRERRASSLAGAIAVAVILPLHATPIGMFAASPRYIAFILPVIVGWTIPPLIDELRARSRAIAATMTAFLVLIFAWEGFDCAVNDRFAPFEFVREAAKHPGTRRVYFRLRAGSVVDRLAGPGDTIAVDGTFETWVYPAYGAGLTRNVIFLPANATPDDIPPSAQWVMIDRSWNRLWTNPQFTDMGKFWTFIGKGIPDPEDVKLLHELQRDPRWILAWYDPTINNAVFRRLAPVLPLPESR